MADPGMYGRLGKVPRRVKSNRTVRPPTESGQATLSDKYRAVNQSTGTHVATIPSHGVGDLLNLVTHVRGAGLSATPTAPTGWTQINVAYRSSDIQGAYYIRVADGTEGSTVDVPLDAAGNDGSVFLWVVNANGFDYATTPPEAGSFIGNDPPSISPSFAPTTVAVVSVWGTTKAILSGPSGYTQYGSWTPASSNNSQIYAASKIVNIVTSEDPGTWTPESTTGQLPAAFTIAIPILSTAPVAAGDHTHVEADVTDLDHDDTDAIHDNVAGEIAAVTEKVTPVNADLVLIEDSAAANAKKRVQVGNLPGGGVTDHGALTGLADDDHAQYLLAAGTRAATFLEVSGLTGATASSPRFVGGTLSGAPASGTFALGDYVVTEDGNIFVCTTAGTPGTWTAVGAGAATDADAIHDNVAAEISVLTLVTAASGDHVLIEDASDSNNKKRVAASDFLGGASASLYAKIDEAPGTPDAFDDEFDDDTITGWTAVAAGTAPTWTEDTYGLHLACAAEAGHNWKFQLKAIPASDWTVAAKMAEAVGANSVDFHRPNWLVVTDGTTTAAKVLGIGRAWNQNATSFWSIGVSQLTNFTTFNAVRANVGNDLGMGTPLYFRITKASTTFTFQWSPDGITWFTAYSATAATFGFTPTHIGLGGSVINATHGMSCTFEWIRKTA